MDTLNEFELSILERVASLYPEIKNHIPYLRVLNRNITGVGMYVNFFYLHTKEQLESIGISNTVIGTDEDIEIPGLKDGLIYEVNISIDGKIEVIELVTYDEEWWGQTEGYNFIPRTGIDNLLKT